MIKIHFNKNCIASKKTKRTIDGTILKVLTTLVLSVTITLRTEFRKTHKMFLFDFIKNAQINDKAFLLISYS